ncbi:MAG: hypothetical protein Q7V88_00035 [Actinomycetota bacterium]|nr:hypothetical protein [Actinomycetota bacterium]
MADELTPATFADAVGSTFIIQLSGPPEAPDTPVPYALTLTDVVPHAPSGPQAPRAEPFSLVFLGPAGGYLSQRTYALQHAALGVVELFLVPLGPQADGQHRYEAVFN